MALLEASISELLVTEPEYTKAAHFYEGTVPEHFASWRLQRLLAGTGDRFRINFARTPVDVLLERTVIESASHPTNTEALQQVWDDNELDFESTDIHRRTYEFGDCYAIVWPDDTLACGAAIYGHDPRTVRLFYDKQRPREKSHAIQMWPDDELNRLRVNLYTREQVERYVAVEEIGTNVPIEDMTWDLEEIIPNPVPGVLPVFHFRNQRTYGTPEHKDAYGPQEMINKLLITMMASVDYAGFPQRYVLTDSSLDPSPEDDFGPLPLPEGSLTTPDQYTSPVDEASRFEAGPGSTWLLGGANLKVGQFATADSDNFLKPLQSLIQMMAAVTDVPMHYFSLSGDMPSGESYRAANGPLDRKAEQRMAMLGAAWGEMLDYCLSLRGIPDGAEVLWSPIESIDSLDFWETQVVKDGLGVPREELLAEGGYSRSIIGEWDLTPEPEPEPAPTPIILPPTPDTEIVDPTADTAL